MTVNRERMMVWSEYEVVNLEYDTLDEAIERFQRYRDAVGGSARFEQRCEPYSDDSYLALVVSKPETDAQMRARIGREEFYATQQEERDRREFERLSKKFGKQD